MNKIVTKLAEKRGLTGAILVYLKYCMAVIGFIIILFLVEHTAWYISNYEKFDDMTVEEVREYGGQGGQASGKAYGRFAKHHPWVWALGNAIPTASFGLLMLHAKQRWTDPTSLGAVVVGVFLSFLSFLTGFAPIALLAMREPHTSNTRTSVEQRIEHP